MKIQKITEDELDYVRAICLDPSIGPQSREAMRSGMTDRICWIRKMMQRGLEILVALEKPKMERFHYKWAGNMLHADLAVHGQVPKGLLESVPIEFALEPVKGKNSLSLIVFGFCHLFGTLGQRNVSLNLSFTEQDNSAEPVFSRMKAIDGSEPP